MSKRYDTREDYSGWTVFDIFTGHPVVIMEVAQVGLDIQDALDLADLLERTALKGDRRLHQ